LSLGGILPRDHCVRKSQNSFLLVAGDSVPLKGRNQSCGIRVLGTKQSLIPNRSSRIPHPASLIPHPESLTLCRTFPVLRVGVRSLLPTAYCLLPTAYCLLPTAYCLLPTAYCLLTTDY
jgi:hypothetical protein